MKLQSAIPKSKTHKPHQLINQPTSWPLFYLLPQTHYVKRQRAANAPQYNYSTKVLANHYEPTSRKLSFLQRGIYKLITIRNRAWLSLKRLGRKIVHALVKWCILPLAVAACFSMIDVMPAELPEDYFTLDNAVQIDHSRMDHRK